VAVQTAQRAEACDVGDPDRSGRDYWDPRQRVFAAALAAEDSARAAILDARCGRAPVRAEVKLLAAYARAGEFITPPTLDGSFATLAGEDGPAPALESGRFNCESDRRWTDCM
jgi:hypothetical protein